METVEFDDDDDEIFNVYENVQWYWDDKINALNYKSEKVVIVEEIHPMTTGILGSVEFRQDIDLNEQQKFRKRFQRKYGPTDVVTLQDIKDVVLFTAPQKLLTPAVIGILHLAASERLIRALILYCQYYLQISDVMKTRIAELQTKIRTQNSDTTEAVFRKNLECLRLLVGKEYSAYITGSGDFVNYHHMGKSKNAPSLLKRERFIFEAFLRIQIQIVWIALSRKSFTQIELEVNRIFKSHIFNIAQHVADRTAVRRPSTPIMSSSRDTRDTETIFTGHCLLNKKKVNTMSPIIDEVQCASEIDYRVYGLGIVRYPKLDDRLQYFENALALAESEFKEKGIYMGILGLPRNNYDIMLNEIEGPAPASSSESVTQRRLSKSSYATSKQSTTTRSRKTAPSGGTAPKTEMVIPEPKPIYLIDEFPCESMPRRPRDLVQRSKWLRKCYGGKKISRSQ